MSYVLPERAKKFQERWGVLHEYKPRYNIGTSLRFHGKIHLLRDRYPINTNRRVQPTKFFKEISNEFFR